ncbi:hypothetical protein [Tropicimonas sp. IMCC34011]|uniref:hypothetical protein n=1 Tax=Tropicimonas sp. IMCC34011 TaxID=2248759 RepID=UPI000E26F11C|nr:hypothetical protein [Tropicimonas sp. IMCC34011]
MSANNFVTERNHVILLVPFLYAFFSRMRRLRAFGFNAVTLWGPGLLLTTLLLDDFSVAAVSCYFAGYFVFISVYELGYLMNDTWGLRHDETPRRRIDVDYSPTFLVLFVAIRLVTVLSLGFWVNTLSSLWFWALLGLLVLAILAHNLVVRQEFKMATFFQMSLMRFSIPVFIATAMEEGAIVILIGCLFFVFPRFLTYLDSKNRLRIPERKQPGFLLVIYAVFAPVVLLISVSTGETLMLFAWAYFMTYASLLFAGRHLPFVEKVIGRNADGGA